MPQNRMHHLIPYKDLLNMKQKKELLHALQTEKPFSYTTNKDKKRRIFRNFISKYCMPFAVQAVKKLFGSGAPRIVQKTSNKSRRGAAPQIGLPKMPPPFYSYPQYVTGQGVKKSPKKKGKGLLLGPKSPFTNIPILGGIL